MINNRSLCIFLLLAVVFVLLPIENLAAQPKQDKPSDEQLLQVYSDLFFFGRSIEFAQELTLREAFLSWLLKGIVLEASKRQKEDLNGTIRAINPPEIANLDESVFAIPENLGDSALHIKYLAWEKSQRDEFNHRYLKARLIKENLIRSGTPTQRYRMFKNDLESAIYSYRDRAYPEAILRFDELITQYGYQDLADIIFYRGESYFALRLYDFAARDYKRMVEGTADDWMLQTAFLRLLSISGENGEDEEVVRYWQEYQERFGEGNGDIYWAVVDVVSRCMMVNGNATEAKDLFISVPASSAAFIESQYLAAECALMNLDLVDAEDRFSELTDLKFREVAVPAKIRQKAKLKLGYVHYLHGDFDLAFVEMSRVTGSEDVQEKATIASAWALYRLGAVDQAVTLCRKFLEKYPNSDYLYEANALVGYSREVLGADSSAIDQYQEIMVAVDDRQEYQEFNYEKKQVNGIIQELSQLEKEIFENNRKDLFPAYLELRRYIGTLVQKIRLVEGYKSNPELKEMIQEQAALFSMIEKQSGLEEAIKESGDRKLLVKLEDIVSDLFEMTQHVNSGIRYSLSQSTLIQREENQNFAQILSDTLKKSFRQEWLEIERILEEVKSLQNQAAAVDDPQLRADIAGLEIELAFMRDRLMDVRSAFRDSGRKGVTSNLDDWSDFAYQRYTYGGLDFDRFYSQQGRIEDLDKYIFQVNRILAERRRQPEETSTLPEELALQSKTGEKAYYAPPIPIWDSYIKVETPDAKPAVDSSAVQDTIQVEEVAPPDVKTAPAESGETKPGAYTGMQESEIEVLEESPLIEETQPPPVIEEDIEEIGTEPEPESQEQQEPEENQEEPTQP